MSVGLTWENETRPPVVVHRRPLTHSLDLREEGLAMQATCCSVEGCDRPTERREYCGAHYQRFMRQGDAGPSAIQPKNLPKLPCVVASCDRVQYAQSGDQAGYCTAHRQRVQRLGHPGTKPIETVRPVMERFWERVRKTSGCWFWTATLNGDGYGMFRMDDRKNRGAHRAAYLLLVGPIPDGMEIDHLCRVRNCVRPDHLEPVTPAENRRRANRLRWHGANR